MAKKIIPSSSSKSHSEKMLGLGQELWRGIDPLKYIRQERADWDKKYTDKTANIAKGNV